MFIFLLYLLVGVLLLWVVIWSKGYWAIKTIAIITTVFFTGFLHTDLENRMGYPYSGELPDKFQIFGVIVDEPDFIYLWIQDLEGKVPRSHSLIYTRNGHEQAEKIKEMLQKGKAVYGRAKGGLDGFMNGLGNGEKGWGGLTSQGSPFILYDLPPPNYPRK